MISNRKQVHLYNPEKPASELPFQDYFCSSFHKFKKLYPATILTYVMSSRIIFISSHSLHADRIPSSWHPPTTSALRAHAAREAQVSCMVRIRC